MGWLDNAIGWLSPKAGYNREFYRLALRESKNYDAGGWDRLNANWRVFNESADVTDRYSRNTVRARARDLERNSDLMNALVGSYKRNVFGAGYRLRAGSEDDELNQEIERLWKLWCKKQNCDVTGTQSFDAMMRMAIQRKKIDGGILLLKRYTPDGFVPFKLQALEVDELDATATAPKTKNGKVVGGIEYSPYNRPVGYYIQQYSLDGITAANPIYVKAKDVIFYFSKNRPSQIREMSDMTPTVARIRDTNEFMRSISVKERILACLSVFIKHMPPGIDGAPGRPRPTGSGAAKGAGAYDYQGKTLTPGMIQYLNPGDEVEVVNPSGQATDATSYIKQAIRLIGSGQGLSYETVSRDMSESNYSSARQGMIEDELTYLEDRAQLMEVMDEIYETFVISLALAGKIHPKNFWERKEDYLKHKWIQAPKKWIDPLKEANANKTSLNTGQKTWADLAGENGRDWKEQINEMAEIIAYGEEKGIDMGGVIFGNQKTSPYQGAGSEKASGDDKTT